MSRLATFTFRQSGKQRSVEIFGRRLRRFWSLGAQPSANELLPLPALLARQVEVATLPGSTMLLTTPVERDGVRVVQCGDVYGIWEGGEVEQVKWERWPATLPNEVTLQLFPEAWLQALLPRSFALEYGHLEACASSERGMSQTMFLSFVCLQFRNTAFERSCLVAAVRSIGL